MKSLCAHMKTILPKKKSYCVRKISLRAGTKNYRAGEKVKFADEINSRELAFRKAIQSSK